MGVIWIPFEGIRELMDGDEVYISEEGMYGHHQEQMLGYLHRGVGWLSMGHPDLRVKLAGAAFFYGAKVPLMVDAWLEKQHESMYDNSINTYGGGRSLSQQTGSVVISPSLSAIRGSGSPRIPSRSVKGDDISSSGAVVVPR